MNGKTAKRQNTGKGGQPQPVFALKPAAKRALAEAEARRAAIPPQATPAETGGPDGPEPTRYGDWEKGGIASDF